MGIKVLTLLLFINQIVFAQFNPQKPDLCQGAFFTVEEGMKFHQELAQKVPDSLAWAMRRTLIKQGILDGAELTNFTNKTPTKPIIHSLKKMNGYTVENVAFESLPGFYVTGNLYRPLNMKGKKAGILCTHGHWEGFKGRFLEQTQQRCITLARMGAVVFA